MNTQSPLLVKNRNISASLLLALFSTSVIADTNISELHTITVSGSAIEDRFESNLHDPSSSTLIKGEQIDEQHATNIIEILRGIPGVTADLAGEGDGIKIKLRGVENQRYMGEKPGVAIVIDGVPVFERTGKVNIDLDNIESIRVIKGGASYLYGEDALAGAVIITTKRGARHEGVSVEYDRGSFGYQRKYIKGGFANDHFGGHLQYAQRETDGYYALSNRDTKTLSGNLQWFINNHSDLTFGFERSDRYRDREGNVTGVTRAKEDPKGEIAGRGRTRHFDVELGRYNLTYSNDFSNTGNLMAIAYQYDDKTDYWSAPVRFDAAGLPVNDTQVDAYEQIVNYLQQQRGIKLELRESFGRWGVMGGAEVKRNTFDEISRAKQDYSNRPGPTRTITRQGTISSTSYREETTKAAYTEAKFGLTERTDLTLNYRIDQIELNDRNRLTNVTRDKAFDVQSWRIGADHQLHDNHSVYGGISTGFRVPTLSELSTNAQLKPEHSYNYEIGLRSTANLFGWQTQFNSSVFYLERKDFITSTSGQYVSSTAPNATYHDNIGNTVSQGLELALQTEIQHQLSFDFAYTFLNNYYTKYDDFYLALGNARGTRVNSLAALTDPNTQVFFQHYNNKGNQLPRTPNHQANFRTHWQPNQAWRLTTEIDYRGESYADEINQEKLPTRTLVNLTLAYNTQIKLFGGKRSKFSAFIKVDNLLNDQFFAIARGFQDSTDQNGNYNGIYNAEDLSIIVDPGRVFSAGIGIKF